MTYTFDETVDGRWYVYWNGEFISFRKSLEAAFSDMIDHLKNFE